jgi:hypothetical protein
MPWRPFSERRLHIEAFQVASMLDSVPVEKKKVEDPGGKWMHVLRATKHRGRVKPFKNVTLGSIVETLKM